MELSLIRNLMDKDFYNNNKGTRCPDKLFTKDIGTGNPVKIDKIRPDLPVSSVFRKGLAVCYVDE